MQAQAIQQAIDEIESVADQAMAALKNGTVQDELKQRVKDLHEQARAKRSPDDKEALTQGAMSIEQAADKAMEACRNAGNVDPALQQAIKDAHQKASKLKHSLESAAV